MNISGFGMDTITLAGPLAIVYFLPNSIQLLRDWQPGLMTYPHPLAPASAKPSPCSSTSRRRWCV